MLLTSLFVITTMNDDSLFERVLQQMHIPISLAKTTVDFKIVDTAKELGICLTHSQTPRIIADIFRCSFKLP